MNFWTGNWDGSLHLVLTIVNHAFKLYLSHEGFLVTEICWKGANIFKGWLDLEEFSFEQQLDVIWCVFMNAVAPSSSLLYFYFHFHSFTFQLQFQPNYVETVIMWWLNVCVKLHLSNDNTNISKGLHYRILITTITQCLAHFTLGNNPVPMVTVVGWGRDWSGRCGISRPPLGFDHQTTRLWSTVETGLQYGDERSSHPRPSYIRA